MTEKVVERLLVVCGGTNFTTDYRIILINWATKKWPCVASQFLNHYITIYHPTPFFYLSRSGLVVAIVLTCFAIAIFNNERVHSYQITSRVYFSHTLG